MSTIQGSDIKSKPHFGWVELGDGWLEAPNDFAQDTAFITKEYFLFAERMRSRWDLIEYIRTVLRQMLDIKRIDKD